MKEWQQKLRLLMIRARAFHNRLERFNARCGPTKTQPAPLNDPGPCDQVCAAAVTMREIADEAQAIADTAKDIWESAQDVANSADSIADIGEADCVTCLNQNS